MKHILSALACVLLTIANLAPAATKPLPNEPVLLQRDKSVVKSEMAANNWTQLFLAADYQPPVQARYVLSPRKGDISCDSLHLSYKINESRVTISQTFAVFSVQVDWHNTKDKKAEEILPVGELQEFARQLFADADQLELQLSPGAIQRPLFEGAAKRRAITNTPWLDGSLGGLRSAVGLRWNRKKGQVNFFLLKDDGRKAPKFSIGYGLFFNRFWYVQQTEPIPDPEENDSQYVIQKLILPQSGEVLDKTMVTPYQWTQRFLSDSFQAPEPIRYIEVKSNPLSTVLQASYEPPIKAKQVVTITQTKDLAIMQIERPADPRPLKIIKLNNPNWKDDHNTILSIEEVQETARQVFKEGEQIKIIVLPEAENKAGRIVSEGTKVPNELQWTQSEGQIVFYWPQKNIAA